MQSFPINQLPRFYDVFKFSEDVAVIITPTTLGIGAGKRVSYSENHYSLDYANSTTFFKIEEKNYNGHKLALCIPVVNSLNDLMNGYESVQSVEFLREPGLTDTQFVKNVLSYINDTTKFFDDYYPNLIKEANDLGNSNNYAITALARLKDYETGNIVLGFNNYFGFYVDKSAELNLISGNFKLCQFNKVPDFNQSSLTSNNKGFNFVTGDLLMNQETKDYVDYKFNQPIHFSR